jgi:hypothetical protein
MRTTNATLTRSDNDVPVTKHDPSEPLTIEMVEEMAKPNGPNASHREVTLYLGSYQEAPLPSADPAVKPRIMGFGGRVRYLFHDQGVKDHANVCKLIEMEYINGQGVVREIYLDGQQIARVWTAREDYAPEQA